MPGQPIQTNRSLKLALNQQQVLDPACNEHLHPVLNSELQGGVTKYRVYLCKKQGFMNTHKTRSLSAYFSDSLIILISSFKVLGPRATFHFDLRFSCFTYCLTCFMLKIVYFKSHEHVYSIRNCSSNMACICPKNGNKAEVKQAIA